jgi:predicted dehydrogenase
MPIGATLGIGQVGVGGIARTHRDGYRAFGMNVVAGCDSSDEALRLLGETAPEAAQYNDLASFLEDPAVDVVDLAVPHAVGVREPIVAAIVAAGKPILIQKPLAMTYGEAEGIAKLAENAQVPIMVNQNMCFGPSALGLHHALNVRKAVGQPTFAQIRTEAKFDTDRHHWYGREERWWTVAVSVHHLALFHHLFGPPMNVFALIGNEPGQPGVTGGDGYGHLSLTYADGMQALLVLSGTYYGTQQVKHGFEHMWVQGHDGLLDWTPDQEIVVSARRPGDRRNIDRQTIPAVMPGDWFPNGFGLVMLHFQHALKQHTAPWCSIADNLYVMAVIEAAYRSKAERRVVGLAEIMGARFDPDYGPGCLRGMSDWVERVTAAYGDV